MEQIKNYQHLYAKHGALVVKIGLLGFVVLQDVVNDRIKHCVSHVAGDADECAVCVGTGKCRLY